MVPFSKAKSHLAMGCRIALICLVLPWLLNACIAMEPMPQGKPLLTNQTIKGNENIDKGNLEPLLATQGNRKVLGTLPYLYIYFIGRRFYDSSAVVAAARQDSISFAQRIRAARKDGDTTLVIKLLAKKDKSEIKNRDRILNGNYLMRTVGEPPVLLDTALVNNSVNQIQGFYRKKGYFEATVHAMVKYSLFGNAHLTYEIEEGAATVVDSVHYDTPDTTVKRIILTHLDNANIKKNGPYDEDAMVAERERLDKLLRSNGYYNFSRNFIEIWVDTANSFATKRVSLGFIIKDPPNGPHKQYTLTGVNVSVDRDKFEDGKYQEDSLEKVYYTANKLDFSLRILNSKLLVRAGDPYNITRLVKSQNLLMSMDQFAVANLGFDTTNGRFDLNISLSRLQRFAISTEGGVLVSSGAPGPFAEVGFKSRNPFRSLGVYDIFLRYSEEGQFSLSGNPNQIFRATEFSINTSITSPILMLPFVSSLNSLRSFNPRTRFQAGYTFSLRPQYTRRIARATFSYLINPNERSTLGISLVDLSLYNTDRIDETFNNSLIESSKRGANLLQSFSNSIISSLSGYYITQGNSLLPGVSYYFRVDGEVGGMTSQLLTGLLRTAERDSVLGLKIFRFSRVSFDWRLYKKLSKFGSLAFRVSAGAAAPWGQSEVLPWEKYFFVGGANSIRAWGPRQLGPGGFAPKDSAGNIQYGTVEQPGNFFFETNLELRRRLFSIFEGAVFIDAGNSWTLRPTDRPYGEADLLFPRAFSQIAIGTGVGLRFNLSFLILRIDLGIKAYEPARPDGERWVIRNLSWARPFGAPDQAVIAFGVGYPF